MKLTSSVVIGSNWLSDTSGYAAGRFVLCRKSDSFSVSCPYASFGSSVLK